MRLILLLVCLFTSSLSYADVEIFSIDDARAPHVWMSINKESEGSSGIGIFQRSTGMPYLTLSDKNGDGVFDLLTYSVLDENGNIEMEVEDYGMDGQADLKINFSRKVVSIYLGNSWHHAHASPEKDEFFSVNGKKVVVSEAIETLRSQHGL